MKKFLENARVPLNPECLKYKIALGFILIFVTSFGTGLVHGIFYAKAINLVPNTITFHAPLHDLSIITKNNILLACSLLLGFITIGVFNIFSVIYNGFVMGSMIGSSVPSEQTIKSLSLILPHGIFEIGWIISISVLATQMGIAFYQLLDSNLENRGFFSIIFVKRVSLWFSFVVVVALIEVFVTPSIFKYVNDLKL